MLNVRVLGPTEVTVDGDRAPLGAPQERAVFTFLALHPNEAVPVGTLVDLLWGDDPPSAATRGVQTQIFRVRKRLARLSSPSPIDTVGSAYRLDVDLDHVDASRCTALASDGRDRAAAHDYPGAIGRLNSALALFQGLPAPDLGDTPLAQAERTRLDELRSTITVDLFDAHIAAGASRELIPHLEAAISAAPYEERLYALLMVALSRSGRQADALGVFQRARSLLVGDIGIEPGPDLRRVERMVLDQDPDLFAGPTPTSAERAADPSRKVGVNWTGMSWAPDVGAFVGRDAELAVAASVWDEVVRTGSRRLLLVSGEAGIGKSRFTAELARHVADRGGLALRGACDPGIGSYGPFTDALDSFTERCPSNSIAVLSDGIDPAASRVTRLVTANESWLPESLDVEMETARTVAAVDALVRRLSASVPTLLILDDLHWAATPTIRLILHMMRRRSSGPLLIVGAHRDDMPSASALRVHIADLHRTELVEALALRGLSPDEVATFVSTEIGQALDEVTRSLSCSLDALTGGNPFFLGSLIAYMRDREVLRREGARWEVDSDLLGHGLPTGVREVLDDRITKLGPAPRTALQAAAVVGSVFHLDVVSTIMGMGSDPVLEGLEAAAAAGLIVEGPRFGEFSFVHDLVREVLAARVGATRRARWHWATATSLHVLDLGCAQEIGVHTRAGLPAVRDVRLAAVLLRAAGVDAMTNGEPAVAVAFLDDAIAVLGAATDPGLLADTLTDRAVALLEGDLDPEDEAFIGACEAAERAALATGDAPRILRAVTLEHRHQSVEHVDRRRVRVVDEALGTLDGSDDVRAVLASFAAELRAYGPDHTQRLQLSGLARSLLHEGTAVDVRESVLTNLVLAHSMDPDELELARRLARDLMDLGRPVGFAVGAVVSALVDVHHGQVDSVGRAADLIRSAGGSRGSRAGVVVSISLGLSVAIARADWATFELLAGELEGIEPRPRTARFHATILRLAASAARVAGRPSEGLAEVLLDAATIDGYEDVYLTTAGWACLMDGNDTDASAIWRNCRIVDDPAFLGSLPGAGRLPTIAAAAELAIRYGSAADARSIFRLLVPYTGTMVVSGPLPFGPVDVYLANLAIRLGMTATAQQHLERAVRLCVANGIVGWDFRIEHARSVLARH